MENKITKNTETTATSSRDVSTSLKQSGLSVKTELSWLNENLESEVLNIFQPLYSHTLTKVEIKNIADSLADIAELWIKFNWRINHAR